MDPEPKDQPKPNNKTMCAALNHVTEDEWHDQVKKVDALLACKNWMTGAIAALAAVIGVGMWMVNRSVSVNDSTMTRLTDGVTGLTTEMAVFRQEVKPFIQAGPRFTAQDYEQRIAADLARFRDTLPSPEMRQQMKNMEQQLAFLQSQINSLSSLLESFEKRAQPAPAK